MPRSTKLTKARHRPDCGCGYCKRGEAFKRYKYVRKRRQQKYYAYIKSIMRVALDIANDFEELCPQHRPELINLAKRYTGSDAAAEDLTQEALLKGFRHWHQFKQETTDLHKDVGAWLKTILTNTFYTEWQRDQKRNQMHEDFASEFDEIEERPSVDENERLHKFINKLRPMYKEVIELHYMQDKSYQEIADTLGIKFVQVQKRLYRARQYVKTYYEQAGLQPPI